jgi:hypothetical protein
MFDADCPDIIQTILHSSVSENTLHLNGLVLHLHTIATKNDNMDPTNLRALALENDPELQEIERVINNLEEGASYASRNVEDAVETAEGT